MTEIENEICILNNKNQAAGSISLANQPATLLERLNNVLYFI